MLFRAGVPVGAQGWVGAGLKGHAVCARGPGLPTPWWTWEQASASEGRPYNLIRAFLPKALHTWISACL